MQMSLKFGVVGRLGRGQEREVPREEREGQGRRRLLREVMPHLQQEGLTKNTAGQKGSGREEDEMVGRTFGGSSLVCNSSCLCGRGSLLRWSSLLWRGWVEERNESVCVRRKERMINSLASPPAGGAVASASAAATLGKGQAPSQSRSFEEKQCGTAERTHPPSR